MDNAMIQRALGICKQITALASVLVYSMVGSTSWAASASESAAGPCDARVDAVARALDTRGGGNLPALAALKSLIDEAHSCFGAAYPPLRARLLNYETYALVDQRRFAAAEAVFERFFTDYVHRAEPEVIAKMHLRRGYVYERLGQTAAMLSEYARAAALAEQLTPPEAASTLRNAGEYYALVNDLSTAKRYFVTAESLLVRLYENDPAAHSRALGIVRLRRARVLIDEGARDQRAREEAGATALPLLESALALLPPTQSNAYYRLLGLLYIVELQWLMESPQDARTPLAEAHRLRPWIRNAYPQLESNLWRKEAYTNYLLGQYTEAARAYETALALAREAGEREEAMRALIGLGEVAEAETSTPLAERLRRAASFYREAAAVAEQIRASYGSHDWSVAAWEQTQEPYLNLTRVLLEQDQATAAFLTLDETRARYLRDLRASAQLHAQLDAATRSRLDSLTTLQQDARYRLGQAQLTTVERTRLELQVVETQQAIERLTRRVAVPSAPPLSLDALQRLLDAENKTVISYFFDGEEAWAFVIRSDTLAAHRLATNVRRVHTELAAIGGSWSDEEQISPRLDLRPLHRLYRSLFAPIAPLIPEETELVIIPEGPLSLFPFGLLVERPHDRFAYADAPYLLRRYPISTELAASLLVAETPPSTQALALLALGRSRFGGLLPTVLGGEEAAPLEDLPAVETELSRLRRHIGGARVVLDEEATESFLNRYVGQTQLLHLASHALIHPSLPLYSQIILWDDPEASDDGTLFLYELQNRALAVDLAVLSGCSTARGQRRTGEGMLGLQYAFRAAGARATLATLWQVDDRASAEFFDHFYRHLSRGYTKSEALQRAQLAYLADHEGLRASPFFWAAPVLYGDTAALSLPPGAPSPLWLPLGLVLAAAGLALPRLLHRRDRA